MRSHLRPLKKASFLLILPTLEFLFLRFLLREGLSLRIGYRGMTDYDFVFPSILAFLAMVFFMENTHRLDLRWNRPGFYLNMALLGLFFLSSLFYPTLTPFSPIFFALCWAILAVFTILSALLVFISPTAFFAHPRSGLVWPAFAVGASTVFSKNFLVPAWQPATRLTGRLVCGALSPMVPHLVCGKNISAVPLAVGEGYAIYHSKHSIIIGLGCGGMEGVYFFLFASVLILMAHGERCHLLEGVLFMSVGAAGIYLMNTLRICIYYLAVLAVAFCAGNSSSFLAAEILFHNALGWILYGAYLVLYLKTWSILLLAREQKSPIFFRPKRLFQV